MCQTIGQLRRYATLQETIGNVSGLLWTAPDYRQRREIAVVNVSDEGGQVIDAVTTILDTAFSNAYLLPDGTKVYPVAFEGVTAANHQRSTISRRSFLKRTNDDQEDDVDSEEDM